MITALILPTILVMVGAVIDLSGIHMAKRKMQASLDQAAITAARNATTLDENAMKTVADASFFANMGIERRDDTQLFYQGTEQSDGNRLVKLAATQDYKTIFGSALNNFTNGKLDWATFRIDTSSEVAFDVRSLELALVLDNSGSMGWAEGTDFVTAAPGLSKLDTLKDAATSLAEDLMAVNDRGMTTTSVRFGIVPFSSMVNVGKSHQNASWIDRYGESSIHHENLDWKRWKNYDGSQLAERKNNRWVRKSDGQILTRQWIYDNAKVVSGSETCSGYWPNYTCKPKPTSTYTSGTRRFANGWKGCVESRPGNLAISDAAPNTSSPDTLFVPSFAPDERNWDPSLHNDYVDSMFNGAYREPDGVGSSEWATSGGESTAITYTRDTIRRGGQADVNKYLMSTRASRLDGADDGPNKGCGTQPVTALTKDLASIKTKIGELTAVGATNIVEGLAWGWRLLSPGAPFTEGAPYSDDSTMKAIILMTDGANTYNPSYVSNGAAVDIDNENDSTYGTFGYATLQNGSNGEKNGRLLNVAGTYGKSGQNLVSAMDTATATLCNSVKNENRKPDGTDGILLVTIAFDVDDGSPVKNLLKNCASNGLTDPTQKLYFDAKNKTDLLAAFTKITEEVSSLRIAR
ncbi:TadE/TadG family type IV pilus assembly protein [Fulvimarina sp. MAC8]|uniref:TadE/TadG family type IV pilus assembly protein n=1 Tax=Fulvimarina sp. MAC8 TaxID=3162874 RepID=UPI0032EE57FA